MVSPIDIMRAIKNPSGALELINTIRDKNPDQFKAAMKIVAPRILKSVCSKPGNILTLEDDFGNTTILCYGPLHEGEKPILARQNPDGSLSEITQEVATELLMNHKCKFSE